MFGMIFALILSICVIYSIFVEQKEHYSNKYEDYDNDSLRNTKAVYWP